MPSPISPIASPQEITPAWLSGLLGARFPGVEVSAVEVLEVIPGTATKIRLRIAYASTGGRPPPPTAWLKAGLEPHSLTETMRAIYAGEALFYRDLAPRLDLGPPDAYASDVSEETGQSLILLEDLVPLDVTFGHATRPVSVATVEASLAMLARLHARFWGDRRLPREHGWLDGGGALGRSGVHDATFAPEIWDRCRALPRGRFMTGRLGDREAMHARMRELLADDQARAQCLVHGDAQLMNMFFGRDGAPGLLDWQTAMWGCWAHDVAEFIVTALTPPDRRGSERSLVARYVAELRRHGVEDLGEAEAWDTYVRQTAYTYHWMLCLPEWQPEPVCLAYAERAHAALADHHGLA